MKIDRTSFFDGFRAQIDSTIEQQQVDGLNFLLDKMEADPFWKFIPQISYALATIYHETAGSFQPVEEGYYLAPPQSRVKAFQKKLRYFPYFGRGYVQLTWKKNYEFAGKQLNVDLVDSPELALTPDVAYRVLTMGMHRGWFTGKKLDDFIKGAMKDYTGARAIINGQDKAGLIAGYARNFEQILTNSAAASNDTSPSAHSIVSDANSNPPETDSNAQPPNAGSVVVEKDVTVGFITRIKLKLTAWLTALGGLTGLTQYKQQLTDLGLPGWLLIYLLLAAVIVFLGWFLYEAVAHLVGIWSRRSLTNALVKANATPDNTVVVACPDDLNKYAAAGYKVIRRS